MLPSFLPSFLPFFLSSVPHVPPFPRPRGTRPGTSEGSPRPKLDSLGLPDSEHPPQSPGLSQTLPRIGWTDVGMLGCWPDDVCCWSVECEYRFLSELLVEVSMENSKSWAKLRSCINLPCRCSMIGPIFRDVFMTGDRPAAPVATIQTSYCRKPCPGRRGSVGSKPSIDVWWLDLKHWVLKFVTCKWPSWSQ